MTKALAALALLVFAAAACRSPFPSASSGGSAKIADVYAASPSTADAHTLLGSGDWWTSAPTFATRPLDAGSMSSSVQYQVIRRFANVGTAETWKVVYTSFVSTSSATTVVTNIQNNAGAGVSGPNVGDKVLYYGQQLTQTGGTAQAAAPYETLTIIRLGAFVIESTWDRKDGFPTVTQLSKIGSKLVSRLKDAVAGKIHATAISTDDLATLPPPNAAMTLLGAVRLPVQAIPLMLNAAAPTEVAKMFTDLGVSEFVFGDYVLDQDTHMEVQAAIFNFTTSQDASNVFDTFRGGVTPDANGLVKSYNDTTGPGQYDIEFLSGTRMGLMICRSTAEASNEAAARSCETPIEVVSAAWAASLKT
ncbi:MAG TPA: hypothetical protein VLK30_07030 [Candidatus Limnocylindrales bacterium]|nr:hypothetical protein [Candidatus Limnocylindrales bacterium]